ncbi:MAG: serine/threonine-protein kinase [Nocardioides sp.]
MTSLGYPRLGERLGPYVVGRRLGGGGMGVVFEAHEENLDRQVAIKIISPHLADDPAFRERFIREARSLASLDSAHVVHVYAHGEATEEEGGRLYLVTQLIPDGDLGGLLQSYGAPPPAMALDLIAQVADGLADAHAAGLIHRDIEPANVLLRRRAEGNQAYLSDFGIARLVTTDATGHQSGTTTGTMGTPTYMAPELHLGESPSVASDVYSLGCLLWATLTGGAPYAGTSDYQVVTAHLEQEARGAVRLGRRRARRPPPGDEAVHRARDHVRTAGRRRTPAPCRRRPGPGLRRGPAGRGAGRLPHPAGRRGRRPVDGSVTGDEHADLLLDRAERCRGRGGRGLREGPEGSGRDDRRPE